MQKRGWFVKSHSSNWCYEFCNPGACEVINVISFFFFVGELTLNVDVVRNQILSCHIQPSIQQDDLCYYYCFAKIAAQMRIICYMYFKQIFKVETKKNVHTSLKSVLEKNPRQLCCWFSSSFYRFLFLVGVRGKEHKLQR